MAGFRKQAPQKQFVKMGFYGAQGSGKTLTAMMLAEALASLAGKRVALIDTEGGTEFYRMRVPERAIHPEPFDFDPCDSGDPRSLTEALQAVRSIDTKVYGVLMVDSISHLWEAAMNAYSGKLTSIGTIPIPGWNKIKRPYKELIKLCLDLPLHWLACGRQGLVFDEDEKTGELKAVGTKMKAEGETPNEPDFLFHMDPIRNPDGTSTICAFGEKDRLGVFRGKTFPNPTFETICKPILPYLGGTHASAPSTDETAVLDADRLEAERMAKERESTKLRDDKLANFAACRTLAEADKVGASITAQLKKRMVNEHVVELREAFHATRLRVGGSAAEQME